MDDGAQEFLKFLQQFYLLYSDLKENDLILTGESYAGKYLPLFTKTILEHNKVSEDKISLKSTFIIDPYPSPVI